MAVVFTVLMVMAGIYALFKWPIPTLAVLGGSDRDRKIWREQKWRHGTDDRAATGKA